MQNHYVRYTLDTNVSGTLIPESELDVIVNDLSDNKSDFAGYTSVFYFDESALEYFKSHKTVAGTIGSLSGFSGDVKTNHLIFDLDSKELEKSYKDAIELINKLQTRYKFNPDSISVFFSGGKGFHVKVKISEELNDSQLKTMCSHIAEGLTTFDPKIYNKTRLIRIVNTKHEKTGLYKREIPMALFITGDITIDYIKEQSKEPGEVLIHSTSLLPEELLNLSPVNNLPKIDLMIGNIENLNYDLRPPKMPYCKYAILNGFFPEGTRNDCLMAMAAFYKSQGYPIEVANQMLLGIIEVQEKRYKSNDHFTREELWNTVISYVYGPNYKGGVPNCKTNAILRAICDSTGRHEHCAGTIKDDLGIQTIDQLSHGYERYIESLDTSLIKTGISFIDKYVKLIKGSSNYCCARSGAGKTNLILNTFRNLNHTKVNSLFFSADTAAVIMYQRMVASVTQIPQDEVERIFQSKDKKRIAQFKELVNQVYGNTIFNVKSSLSMEVIRDSIKDVEDTLGKPIDLVVVDYNERVINQFTDPMNSVRHTALSLVDVSRELNKCFLTIAQVSRSKGSERTPLLSKNAAKESGAVEESANALVTLWRPLYGTDNDRFMGVAVVKNRMGREGIQSILHFDGATSIVRDATEEEKAECRYETQQLLDQEAEQNEH